MTVPLNSRHDIDHDEFMKTRDAVIKEHSEVDVKDHIASVNFLIDELERARKEDIIDFSRNEAARQHIDIVYNKSPRVFGHGVKQTVFSKETSVEFIAALKKEFGLTDPSEHTDAKPSPLETFVSNFTVPEKDDTRFDEQLAE